jgi:hypothetical protein
MVKILSGEKWRINEIDVSFFGKIMMILWA